MVEKPGNDNTNSNIRGWARARTVTDALREAHAVPGDDAGAAKIDGKLQNLKRAAEDRREG